MRNIGSVYASMGERQKALDYFNRALPITRANGYRASEAATLTSIGAAYSDLGEYQKALEYHRQALSLYQSMSNRQGEALALHGVARAERGRGNLNDARAQIEGALGIIESLRTKIASQELRAAYFVTVRDSYEFYIDLLMQLHEQHPTEGHDAAALQASERGRARGLLETLAEAGADIRQGVDAELVERERSLQQRLNAKAQFQMKLHIGTPNPEQEKSVAGDIEATATELQQVEAQIRQASPRYAALTQPKPLGLNEIQSLLDRDTVLLEYALGPEHIILSSDLGQKVNPVHTEGWKQFLDILRKAGISNADLDVMAKKNPAELLGLK